MEILVPSPRGQLERPPSGREERIRLHWDSGSVKLCQGLEIYSFDPSGRPVSVTRKSDIYRRGLNGKLLRIWRYYEGGEKFHAAEAVQEQERWAFLRSVTSKVESLRARLGGDFQCLEPALHINLEDDARNFHELYGEVGILPPDCYRALLLNLTVGCSYNHCSFCHFFKDKTYSLRTSGQFRDHIEQAQHTFGPSLSGRRGIFLGQANAANAPVSSLESALASIVEAFPCEFRDHLGERRHPYGFERVSSFMDTFSQLQRPLGDWRRLHSMGLKALYLGVESGSPKILKLLQKPGHPRFIQELIVLLKSIGMEVNVILMTGVGGREMAKEHVDATVDFLNALPLTAGDRIYLSAFIPDPNSKYARLAEARGLTEMSLLECRQQTVEIRKRLRCAPFPKGPAVTLYDINQFVY